MLTGGVTWNDERLLGEKQRQARADAIKDFTCKNLVVVLENLKSLVNIGPVVRNVNALGAD